MSLRDASQKMSKSSAIDMSRINLLDDEELIIKKIKKAKTDSEVIKPESLEERLELKNLLNIYAALTDQNPRNIINQYSGQGFAKFKLDLASIIVEVLKPIKEKYDLLIKNKAEIIKIAHNNAIIASETAEEKLQQVKSAVGFVT
jgi:tryptophanyl-tRNA synthetase